MLECTPKQKGRRIQTDRIRAFSYQDSSRGEASQFKAQGEASRHAMSGQGEGEGAGRRS
jgi:hypothetical protein